MALPKLDDVSHDVTIPIDDDLTVVFQLRPIAGHEWDLLHTDPDGEPVDLNDPPNQFCVDLITAGVGWVYSSRSNREPFTRDDARELWEDWPQHARIKVLAEVLKFNRVGVDPKAGSTPPPNDG